MLTSYALSTSPTPPFRPVQALLKNPRPQTHPERSALAEDARKAFRKLAAASQSG
ncbi:MAG: hypothetical protein AAF253_04015 [Pseudomonadota bacterium]